MIQVDFIPYKKLTRIPYRNNNLVGGIGVFDGVHLGHQLLIKGILESSKEVGYKSAIITFYPPTRFLFSKSQYLLTTNLEKVALFEKFGIEYVLMFEFTKEFAMISPGQFLDIIRKLGVKALYAGMDFRFGRNREGSIDTMKTVLEKFDISVKGVDVLSLDKGKISSTNIKKLILIGDIKGANKYLGYNFFITGIPYKAKENWILISHLNKVKPCDGIYRVFIKENKEYVKIQNGIIYLPKKYEYSENNIIKISFLGKDEKSIKNNI